MKGCTNPNTYESTIKLLSKFTLLLDFAFIDPSGPQSRLAFPMNVIALLPYMVQNYEDANDVCITRYTTNSPEYFGEMSFISVTRGPWTATPALSMYRRRI